MSPTDTPDAPDALDLISCEACSAVVERKNMAAHNTWHSGLVNEVAATVRRKVGDDQRLASSDGVVRGWQ